MKTALILLCVQAVLGAIDNLWHHELQARLPQKRSARTELALHTAREFFYAFLFIALAWFQWHGAWMWLIVAVIAIEIVITLTDFVVEDMTRRLPKAERVLHTILAINVGAIVALMIPTFAFWYEWPSDIVRFSWGNWSWALTVFGVGVGIWAIRDLIAVVLLTRPPEWQRRPLDVGASDKHQPVIVTGATGFIGSHLTRHLVASGHEVIVLTRNADKAYDRFGPAVRIVTDLGEIAADERIDAIVNLAGAPILGLPWTRKRRARLLASRIGVTQAIADLVRRLEHRPDVVISASAIGYYGVHGNEPLDESAAPQPRFQSELCKRWEAAAREIGDGAVRVVRLRIGLVFGPDGGAFPSLARPIAGGLGAILGTGRQIVSWIHVDDLVRLIDFVRRTPSAHGAINATAPGALSHEALSLAIAEHTGKRIHLRVPAKVLRLALGEMAELLVDGQRVVPAKATRLGFRWHYPDLTQALDSLQSKSEHQPSRRSGFQPR